MSIFTKRILIYITISIVGYTFLSTFIEIIGEISKQFSFIQYLEFKFSHTIKSVI